MLLRATACHDEVAFGTKAKLHPTATKAPAKHHAGLPPSYYHTIFRQVAIYCVRDL